MRLKAGLRSRFPEIASIANRAFDVIRQTRSRTTIAKLLAERSQIFVEFGSDQPRGNGWVTVDMGANADICWDLRKGIPFPNGSVAKIYSSHFMEHLSFGEAQAFLDECLRVLAPGGSFSICVPDARIYIDAYFSGKSLESKRFCGYGPAFNGTTGIDYVNYIAYMGGEHRYLFDQENLLHILTTKGFKNVRARTFDAALDIVERDCQSIYAEAEK